MLVQHVDLEGDLDLELEGNLTVELLRSISPHKIYLIVGRNLQYFEYENDVDLERERRICYIL